MVDYYKTLGVKRTATKAEIKSAYRRLARQRHPDVNGGSDHSAREFALIALAYRTLSDPQERAYYDSQRERILSSSNGGSVLHSNNPHAQRMRRMAVQARWDQAVDRWIESERREAFVRTQAVFTTVTLFLSTFMVALLKPRLWQTFNNVGRAVMVTLFLIGLWHLFSRLRASFEHYTYRPNAIQDTPVGEEEKPKKPFTRFTASAFLLSGYAVSLATGLYLGSYANSIILFNDIPYLFGQQMRPDLFFYPPIAVLLVDTMHTVASKID